jgi:hypothetical protein
MSDAARSPKPAQWTERRDGILRELWPRWDIPVADIASRAGVSVSAAYSRAHEIGLPSRRPRKLVRQ